jgi:uncharacterized protein (TIGR03663 family)
MSGPDESPTDAADDPGPADTAPPAAGPERPPPAGSTTTDQESGRSSSDSWAWDRADELRRRLAAVDAVYAVAAVTAVAVLLRLVALGARPMHFDEARVAYWSLHYMDTGSLAYRPVVHGPFIQLFNSYTFAVVGASDFLARLPVVLAGGLLPATALLFREHLRKDEMVVFALLLAANSIFVYYSRFMRSDVLVAAFMFTAFGLFVRYYDTRDVRLLYAAAVLIGMGFASKENALVYVLTWLGATALVADQALYRPRTYRSGASAAWDKISENLSGPAIGRLVSHAVGLAIVLVVVLVFFYAPRGAGIAGMRVPGTAPSAGATGLWEAVAQPLSFPGYAADTLTTAATDAVDHWGSPAGGEERSLVDAWLTNIGRDIEVLANHGIVLLTFGLLGFVYERYARDTSRTLVIFLGLCGIASLVGYPLADDIGGAHWLHVHVLLPLAVPAAVGLARFLRFGRETIEHRDAIGTWVVVGIAALLVVQVGAATVQSSYVDTTSVDNELAQYAQAEGEARDAIRSVNAVADGEGTDVLIYSSSTFNARPFVGGDAYWLRRPLCVGSSWTNTLPLPWYSVKADAAVDCQQDPNALADRVASDPPPLVVTRTADETVPRERLEAEYTQRVFEWFKYGHQASFWVRDDVVNDVPGWSDTGNG